MASSRVGDESTLMSAQPGSALAGHPAARIGKPFQEPAAEPEVALVRKSCLVFDINSGFRRTVIKIIKHPWFDRFITFLILANCGFLMIDSPVETVDENNMTGRQYAIWLAEYVFLAFFTVEMLLKIIGLGFIRGKGTYLKNGWNWLDFIVVIIGYLSFVGLSNLSALRTFRVLRPLRTLTTVPGMKVIVVSMIASLPALSGVLALSIGMFFVWSVIGIQLWGGILEMRCYYPPTRSYEIPLLRCTGPIEFSAAEAVQAAACSGPVPQSWGCSPVQVTDQFVDKDGEAFNFSSPHAIVSFALDKATGLPDVAARAAGNTCRIPCDGNFCGNVTMGGNDVVILPDLSQSTWVYAGQLILNPDLWPLPRNASYPDVERAKHGVDISKTLAALKLTKNGTEDLWGTEENKEVELVLYPNVTITGGWDSEAFCGAATCEPVQNRSVTVEGECKRFWSPAYGHGSFDDIWLAFLVIFTSVTLEGWVDNMYRLNATFGGEWFTAIYFVLLVLFGAFFVMNLAMAVIWDEYAAADEIRQAKEAADAADEKAAKKKAKKAAKKKHEEEQAEMLSNPNGAKNQARIKREAEEAEAAESAKYWIDNATVRFNYNLVSSKPFDMLITGFILLNTLTLAMEFYDMSDELKLGLEVCNYIFSTIFLIEMILKLWGLGPRTYAKDAFNLFDGVIVIFSVIEISISLAAKSTGGEAGSTGLGALRTFRLMRVFKLARSWQDLQKLLSMIVQSVIDVTNASLLLLIIMFIFTLLGMQLFGGKMKWFYYGSSPADKAKAHFDDFWWGFVTVFQVLTGENWNDVLYNTMHALAQPEEEGHPIVAAIYFILLNVVGNYMILNLFLAILLANFEGGDEEEEEDDADEEGSHDGGGETVKGATVVPMDGQISGDGNEETKEEAGARLRALLRSSSDNDISGQNEVPEEEEAPPTEKELEIIKLYGKMEKRKHSTNIYNYDASSLFVLKGGNPIRMLSFKIADAPWFDSFILFLIFVSSVLLAYDEPHRLEHEKAVLYILDWIISVLFGIEMLLKIVSLGLVGHRGAYLRDPWNILDGIIVCISFLSLMITGAKAVKALRSLRALRALKPLRVVRRYPGLRLVVNAIFRAMPRIANVVLVTMLFFLIFAIVGVQNFMGKLKHCNDGDVTTRAECTGSFNLTLETCSWMPNDAKAAACVAGFGADGTAREFPRMWENVNPFHYDNVGNALLTLFEVTSGEMWPDIMYDTVNGKGIDEPMYEVDAEWPKNASPAVAIYYILVTVVCGFLMLNVFVGVVIDEYNDMKGEEDGSGLMTGKQKQWVDSMRVLATRQPQRVMLKPAQKWRHWFYDVVESTAFDMFIMLAIVLNTCILAMTITPDDGRASILEIINFYVFAILFAIEMVLKLIGLGPVQYFSLGWNKFDSVLVVMAFVGRLFDFGQFATLLRIIRVARVLRLVKRNDKVLTLFKTLLYSMPSLWNVGIILVLLYFIFAVIGMNLFNGIKFQGFLNSDANFDTFGGSFMTLFRCSTGESYNGIMHDVMIAPPYCDEEVGNCGAGDFPAIYFVMFFVLQNYIFLNLIVAIILDVFADTNNMALNEVADRHLDSFRDEWAKFDFNANKWIDAAHLHTLVRRVEYPLGLGSFLDRHGPDSEKPAKHLIGKTDDELDEIAWGIVKELSVYAHKHDASYADTPECVRSDGFVYEISFQETLQEMAGHVGRKNGKSLPVEIEEKLAREFQRKRDAQASKKRRQSAMGLPMLVWELEQNLGARSNVTGKEVASSTYVHNEEDLDDKADVQTDIV